MITAIPRSSSMFSPEFDEPMTADASVFCRPQMTENGFRALSDELRRIRDLEDDYDGMDAVAPSPEIVDTAIAFLERRCGSGEMPLPDAVVAGPSGTVFLEWHDPVYYRELEFVSPSSAILRVLTRQTGAVTPYNVNIR